jgi:hypothetical protein
MDNQSTGQNTKKLLKAWAPKKAGHFRHLHMTRWEDVTTPKQAGGLEDKELANFNRALLSKWIWNWLNSNNHQLSQMIPHLETADRPWEPQSTINCFLDIACREKTFSTNLCPISN